MKMQLKNIGIGAVEESFQRAIAEVVENIVDPNTSPKAMRKIIIDLSIKPDPENRERCSMTVTVSTRLGKNRPHESILYVGVNPATGEIGAEEHVISQRGLFDEQEKETKVRGTVQDIKEAM